MYFIVKKSNDKWFNLHFKDYLGQFIMRMHDGKIVGMSGIKKALDFDYKEDEVKTFIDSQSQQGIIIEPFEEKKGKKK